MVYDVAISGAGAVGLATAYQLITANPELKIVILEKENQVSLHQTGNNSGVIHSGIYYRPGSLKAKNCVEGYKQLLNFSNENDIPYDICGKIILATEERELPALNDILLKGQQNGLTGLKLIDPNEIKAIEPHAQGIQAIWVPQTGIIDYKQVAAKLVELITKKGVEIKLGEGVTGFSSENNEQIIKTKTANIKAKVFVNCSGLYADKIAQLTGQEIDFRIIPFRGEYYKFKPNSRHLVKNLIYPVPDPDFPWLGVHFTRMMDGNVEAGPNAVLAYKREGYKKSDINLLELIESFGWKGFRKMGLNYWKVGLKEFYRSYSKPNFVKALKRLIPNIKKTDLVSGGSGVRALACGKNGELLDDFLILEKKGVVNVCNAPSPAATSCLSIGKTVADKVINQLN